MFYYIKGAFNRHTKVVQWLYRSTNGSDLESIYQYDSILALNTITGAFYPITLPNTNPTINGIVCSRTPLTGTIVDTVTNSGGISVITLGSDTITANTTGGLNPAYFFRYLATNKTGATTFQTTFAQMWNESYLDWGKIVTAVDYSSIFYTH